MFNHADIYDREANGTLKDFARIAEERQLLDDDEQPVRFLWLTPKVVADIAAWDRVCRLSTLAELVDFLVGRPVFWGDLREGNHLKPLNPMTGWAEFKIRTSPQVRIYGAFVDVDVFIGLHACRRDAQPDDADTVFQEIWQALWGFDAYRVTGADPSCCLTEYRISR